MKPNEDASLVTGPWKVSIAMTGFQDVPGHGDPIATSTAVPVPAHLGTLLGWLKSMLVVAAMTLLSNFTLSVAHRLGLAIAHW